MNSSRNKRDFSRLRDFYVGKTISNPQTFIFGIYIMHWKSLKKFVTTNPRLFAQMTQSLFTFKIFLYNQPNKKILVPSDPLGQNTEGQVVSGVFEALFPTEN